MTADEIAYWTGSGKWHLRHDDHAACSPYVILLPSSGRRKTTLPIAVLCGRCFTKPVARPHLRLVVGEGA